MQEVSLFPNSGLIVLGAIVVSLSYLKFQCCIIRLSTTKQRELDIMIPIIIYNIKYLCESLCRTHLNVFILIINKNKLKIYRKCETKKLKLMKLLNYIVYTHIHFAIVRIIFVEASVKNKVSQLWQYIKLYTF